MEGGSPRDLTVNLRLMAHAENKSTAKSLADEVKKISDEIVSAHDEAASAGDELRKASRENAKSIVDDIDKQRKARTDDLESAQKAATDFAAIGQQIKDQAGSFTIGAVDTRSLDEIKAKHRELAAEAKAGTEAGQAALSELGDAYINLDKVLNDSTATAEELAEADEALAQAQLKAADAADNAAEIEKDLIQVRKAEAKATKDLADATKKAEQEKAEAEKKTAKAVADAANAAASIHKEREKVQKKHDNLLKESARHQAAAIQDAKALAGGLTQLARSYALSAAAKAEDSEEALKQIAAMESVIQGLQGTIEVGTAAISMWNNLKAARASATGAQAIASGVSLGAGAAAAAGGGLAAGAAAGAAALAAAAAPAAVLATALGTLAIAAVAVKVIFERFTGTDQDDGSTSKIVEDVYLDNPRIALFMEGLANVGTLGYSTLSRSQSGVYERAGRARESRSNSRFASGKATDLRDEVKKGFQRAKIKDPLEDLDRRAGEARATRGLQGTAADLARNEFNQKRLQAQASVNTNKLSLGDKLPAIQDAIKANQGLVKLAQEQYDIQRRAAREGINAKQKELQLSSRQLAIAERKKAIAQAEADNLIDRLALGSKSDNRKLARAAESTKDGSITLKEAQQLRGIKQFEDIVKSTFKAAAVKNDTAGILGPILARVEAAAKEEKKIKLSVDNTNKIIVALESNEDKAAKKAFEELQAKILDLLSKERGLGKQKESINQLFNGITGEENVFN